MYIYTGIQEHVGDSTGWLNFVAIVLMFSVSQHTFCDFTEAAVCFDFLFMCRTVTFFIFSALTLCGH